jgi:hypothetical protein
MLASGFDTLALEPVPGNPRRKSTGQRGNKLGTMDHRNEGCDPIPSLEI